MCVYPCVLWVCACTCTHITCKGQRRLQTSFSFALKIIFLRESLSLVCVCMFMCAWRCVCICVEARGFCWVSFSIVSTLLSWDRVSHGPSSARLTGWQAPGICLAPPAQHWAHSPCFHTQRFLWVLEIWAQVLMLGQEAFYPLSHFVYKKYFHI